MAKLARRVGRITADPDFASQLTAIITEQGPTDKQAKMVFDTMDPTKLRSKIDFIKTLNKVVKYEGFNPREMIKNLLVS